jgi:hypothetical protein
MTIRISNVARNTALLALGVVALSGLSNNGAQAAALAPLSSERGGNNVTNFELATAERKPSGSKTSKASKPSKYSKVYNSASSERVKNLAHNLYDDFKIFRKIKKNKKKCPLDQADNQLLVSDLVVKIRAAQGSGKAFTKEEIKEALNLVIKDMCAKNSLAADNLKEVVDEVYAQIA